MWTCFFWLRIVDEHPDIRVSATVIFPRAILITYLLALMKFRNNFISNWGKHTYEEHKGVWLQIKTSHRLASGLRKMKGPSSGRTLARTSGCMYTVGAVKTVNWSSWKVPVVFKVEYKCGRSALAYCHRRVSFVLAFWYLFINATKYSFLIHFGCAVVFSANTFLCPNGKGDQNVTVSSQCLVISTVGHK